MPRSFLSCSSSLRSRGGARDEVPRPLCRCEGAAMRSLRRLHGTFWWALDKLAHIPHLGPRRYRAWVCRHYWTDTQAWYWSPPWQWGAWRSRRDDAKGRSETFYSGEELLASLDVRVDVPT